jgi:hypothetical protein
VARDIPHPNPHFLELVINFLNFQFIVLAQTTPFGGLYPVATEYSMCTIVRYVAEVVETRKQAIVWPARRRVVG